MHRDPYGSQHRIIEVKSWAWAGADHTTTTCDIVLCRSMESRWWFDRVYKHNRVGISTMSTWRTRMAYGQLDIWVKKIWHTYKLPQMVRAVSKTMLCPRYLNSHASASASKRSTAVFTTKRHRGVYQMDAIFHRFPNAARVNLFKTIDGRFHHQSQ